jgi:uncharacterized protein YjbI with pentapeptide repeats
MTATLAEAGLAEADLTEADLAGADSRAIAGLIAAELITAIWHSVRWPRIAPPISAMGIVDPTIHTGRDRSLTTNGANHLTPAILPPHA